MKEPGIGLRHRHRLQDWVDGACRRLVTYCALWATLMLGGWMFALGSAPCRAEATVIAPVGDAVDFEVDRFPTNVTVGIHPFGESASKPHLAKGVFLVASRNLVDPNFRQTVVLIVAHGEDGAMGVVVNRPTPLTLGAALPDIEELAERADLLYVGGPVATTQITLLLRAASPPENALHVFQDVYFSGSLTTLMQLIRNHDLAETMQAYAGYAGWAPGQLEGELKRGDWSLVEADVETLFSKSPETIWRELNRQASGLWVQAAERRVGMARLSHSYTQ